LVRSCKDQSSLSIVPVKLSVSPSHWFFAATIILTKFLSSNALICHETVLLFFLVISNNYTVTTNNLIFTVRFYFFLFNKSWITHHWNSSVSYAIIVNLFAFPSARKHRSSISRSVGGPTTNHARVHWVGLAGCCVSGWTLKYRISTLQLLLLLFKFSHFTIHTTLTWTILLFLNLFLLRITTSRISAWADTHTFFRTHSILIINRNSNTSSVFLLLIVVFCLICRLRRQLFRYILTLQCHSTTPFLTVVNVKLEAVCLLFVPSSHIISFNLSKSNECLSTTGYPSLLFFKLSSFKSIFFSLFTLLITVFIVFFIVVIKDDFNHIIEKLFFLTRLALSWTLL